MADDQPGFMQELKQRKVFRVAAAYVLVAWLALQFFDLVLENINAPDWVMQAVMAVLAIGFPVALILAWAFEVTPEGVKAAPALSRAFAALITTISVAAVGFVVWSFAGDESSVGESSEKPVDSRDFHVIDSIAVLPFESLSEGRSDEYFADGLADTLLHKLAQLPNLKVIARNSSFQFKGTNKDAREIGNVLDVGTLLEGSVQRQGDQIRIIAQLIDTTDGTHIWSSTFDDTVQNIFELQDRIADEIMVQLQISISEQDRKRVLRNGTDSPEAYDLLLRANETPSDLNRRNFEPENDPKLALIDQAIEIDPDYAQAWEARSRRFSSALFFDDDPARAFEFIEEARSAAMRAIESDPEYAGGYARLGMSHFRANDLLEAERYLIKALELDPGNANAMQLLGLVKVNDDPQMALDLFTRVRELDPESEFIYRQIYFALDALGRLDEGIAILEEGVERFPGHPILLSDLVGIALDDLGRPDEAARWASKIVESDGQVRVGLSAMSFVWAAVGDVDRSNSWLQQYADRFPDSPDVKLRLHTLEMLRGDPAAARLAIETVPESPSFRFDRATPIGGACLVLGDAACMREQAGNMRRWLDEFEAAGRPHAFRERYELAIAVLRNAAIDDPSERDVEGMDSLLETTGDWPITGGRGGRYVGYLRVMLQSLVGNDAEAVLDLERTLNFEDDGFLYDDIFRLHPDMNPLITRLEGAPGYAQWLSRFAGRREDMRGNLVRMEQAGEILSADDIAP